MPRSYFRWSNDDPVLRPYPLQPVWDLLVARYGSGQRAQEALGFNGSRLATLRRHGRLTMDEADRLALAAGRHPVEVWGDLWLEIPELRDVS